MTARASPAMRTSGLTASRTRLQVRLRNTTDLATLLREHTRIHNIIMLHIIYVRFGRFRLHGMASART